MIYFYPDNNHSNTSLQDIINQATEGEEIIIRKGIYDFTEPIIVEKSITIRSESELFADVTLQYVGHDNTPKGLLIIRDEKPEIIGITFKGGILNGIYCETEKKKVKVKKCLITESKNGIVIAKKAKGRFISCIVSLVAKNGIRVNKKAKPKFKKCCITACGSDGILICKEGKGKFRRCVILENRGSGIFIEECGYGKFEKCTIQQNREYGLLIESGATPSFSECEFTQNANKNKIASSANVTFVQQDWKKPCSDTSVGNGAMDDDDDDEEDDDDDDE